MKIVIVDDEPPARERLKRLVEELSDFEVVAEASNGEEALSVCSMTAADIVLMDIRMPGMDGIEAAQHLSLLDEPPAVIFTTAYNEYAIDAFEAQAVGYVMKPIRQQRLENALNRASKLTRAQLAAIAARSQPQHRSRTQLAARVRDELRLIPVDQVFYLQADHKYVRVKHTEGEVLIDESLTALEDEFGGQFVRIHRNALVARRYLVAIHKDEDGSHFAQMRGCSERLKISRRHVADAKKQLR